MRKSSVVTQPPPPSSSSSHGLQGEERAGVRKKSLFPVVSGGRRQSPHVLDPAGKVKKQHAGARSMGLDGGREASGMQGVPPNLEPTYRMEPDRKFHAPQVHNIIKETLEKHLEGFQFNPKFTPTMTRVLTEELKERVKQLGLGRYKLVTNVILGQRLQQGVVVTSRCAWDVTRDSYAAYTYQNKSLFCTASVYGLYRE